MKITNIECRILKIPDLKENATSSSQDDLVVIVHTDEGITGIGETDTGPWLAKAAIESPGSHTMAMGITELLTGMDPFDTGAIWQKLYTYTCMSGRRGALICAIGAIDMALWDIKGKSLGLPVYKLLGGAHETHIVPYASLQPYGDTVQQYGDSLIEWIKRAKAYGFTAAKLECTLGGPYKHSGLNGSDEEMTDIIHSCRQAVGPRMRIMVDVQYLWDDAKSALRTIQKWENLDIYFVETPLQIDNLNGYALLAEQSPVRIAAGEWQNTRFEFRELMDKGKIDIAQPDIGRVGGFTEAVRVCNMAQDRGKLVVPHCWKSGIGLAATAHLAAATPNCPMIEFLPVEMCDSALRKELVNEPLVMVNGTVLLPERPGLGVELNWDAVEKYGID
ncbi:MAG TPA: mandelate racemase/muconate lactonizing enzyme family protein [Agriterribacter sp.]|nr:mandelate racemase/muconate lactonizing enzyme family protein [Agriterribacter sp.]HRQ52286.1 mandelate racemase/muconate lactonizing enzyme family protein [Agriterribacter sp.]